MLYNTVKIKKRQVIIMFTEFITSSVNCFLCCAGLAVLLAGYIYNTLKN